MSLLELITNALANSEQFATEPQYPTTLNADDIVFKLKPEVENVVSTSLAIPVSGWQLFQTDAELIELGKKFYTQLKRKLKNTNNFNKNEFIGILITFLEKIGEKIGMDFGVGASNDDYARFLVEKLGFLMGQNVAELVLEACVNFEIWNVVEEMILAKTVHHSHYPYLIRVLASKKRSDLLCLCIKHASDLGLTEVLCILKYFLCPSKEAYSGMLNVRKEWESQALLAVERARDKFLSDKKSRIAKEASILLMLAHDGFSTTELCLHYLLAASSVDEVILSSAIGKLNGKETMRFIRYLGKWLKRYEMFPQACPCPQASSLLGLKSCDWVPKLEVIVKYLGLVLDENFTSLVLHSEFHEELKSIERSVISLAKEAKICSYVSIVTGNLKTGAEAEQK